LFDRHGSCLEQPGEPAGSDYYRRIHNLAYPCREVAGIIFAYLGPGEPPLFPAYEFLSVPEAQICVAKALHECNYLQGNEGNIDPPHLSYLHRMFREGDGWAPTTPVQGGTRSANTLFGRDVAPTLEIEQTDFGLRICTVRHAGDQQYVRISNFILPNLSAFPGGGAGVGYSVNWHVPINDHVHWKFVISFQRSGSIDKTQLRQRMVQLTPDYRLVRNQANRYLQDRDEMKDRTFSGLGTSFMVHDACVTETMGPIEDRTQEHLGYTDKAIVAARLQLLRAVKAVAKGGEAPHVVRNAAENAFPDLGAVDLVLPSSVDWRTAWKDSAAGLSAALR
jgi:hypothetical protein